MRRVLLVVPPLVAGWLSVPRRHLSLRRAAGRAAPLPRPARPNDKSAISTGTASLIRLWVGQIRDGNGRTDRVVGVTTASGAISDEQVPSASPMPLSALAIDAQRDGQHQIIVSDGRSAHLYVFADCRLQTVVDNQGAPFLFDLQNLRDHGTGIACSDLGPPSPGRHLVGLQAVNNGQWTVRRTEIDLNGTLATVGQSDTVTATPAQDPAVISAQTISCGDLSISKDGVQQP